MTIAEVAAGARAVVPVQNHNKQLFNPPIRVKPPIRELALGASIDRPSTPQPPNIPTGGGGVGAQLETSPPPQPPNIPTGGGGVGAQLETSTPTQSPTTPTGGGVGVTPRTSTTTGNFTTPTGGGVGVTPSYPFAQVETTGDDDTNTGGDNGAPTESRTTGNPMTDAEAHELRPSAAENPELGPTADSVILATVVVGPLVYGVGKYGACRTAYRTRRPVDLLEKKDAFLALVPTSVVTFTAIAKSKVLQPTLVSVGFVSFCLGVWNFLNCMKPNQSESSSIIDRRDAFTDPIPEEPAEEPERPGSSPGPTVLGAGALSSEHDSLTP
ncbi:hypothetical protein N9L24_04100 [Candidatus Marinamargulisbacteria bacterium]|nr:hypothetical protein [Candidatus Marinamargulisbacteria bacterium]